MKKTAVSIATTFFVLASVATDTTENGNTTAPKTEFSFLSFAEEALSTLWMASCKASKVLTRSKRSTSLAEWQVPEETDQLFDYLYPSFGLDHKDLIADTLTESGRSAGKSGEAPGIFALSSWMDDAIDLWTSECMSSAAKKEVDAVHNTLKNVTRAAGILDWFNSTGAIRKKENQNFFVSYGGDIEYFFPVWGFGIPFDGEITFLGFHGFQGLFPHKK